MAPELCAALLSWAVTLSGYPHPGQCPQVIAVDHPTIEKLACTGRKCKVLGWYPGSGDKVYLDVAMDTNLSTSVYATSILVHELVHYLQWKNGKLENFNCEVALWAEREAYKVQRSYMDAFGTYVPVGQALKSFTCPASSLAHSPEQ